MKRWLAQMLLVIGLSVIASAQPSPEVTPSPEPSTEVQSSVVATPSPTPVAPSGFKRWVEFDAISLNTRYRFVENAAGVTTNDQMQWQATVRARFKFDRQGKYSVYAGLFTGSSITSGWNNTGVGTGSPQTNLYLKQLYFNAKPVKWLEFQVGGIGINNGENTEITGYDNDVYLTGKRVVIKRPENLYFDEISATSGYLGDASTPNVFRRLKNLDRSNYHQFLVKKQVTERVGFSADYTFESGRDTLRQAVRVHIPESRIFDVFLFENYQRISPDVGYGFGAYAEKAITKKFTIGGGFARIDREMLNGDRFPPGKRVYLTTTYKMSREFTVTGALIQGVGQLPTAELPRTRLDLGLNYNFLETLRRFWVL